MTSPRKTKPHRKARRLTTKQVQKLRRDLDNACKKNFKKFDHARAATYAAQFKVLD